MATIKEREHTKIIRLFKSMFKTLVIRNNDTLSNEYNGIESSVLYTHDKLVTFEFSANRYVSPIDDSKAVSFKLKVSTDPNNVSDTAFFVYFSTMPELFQYLEEKKMAITLLLMHLIKISNIIMDLSLNNYSGFLIKKEISEADYSVVNDYKKNMDENNV